MTAPRRAFSIALAAACLGAAAEPLAVIEKRCLSCHNAEAKMAGLDLSTRAGALAGGARGPALAPGDPAASALFARVAKGEMPPGAPLPSDERAALEAWIAAGAPWSAEIRAAERPRSGADWWAWRPLSKFEPPAARIAPPEWREQPVDRLVFAKLAGKGLTPSPPADRRTLIRRVTFDLTGLPPTPEEAEAFAADTDPRAYERLVDRLLASPAYGERWARHWLDVARFGESNGYEQNHLRPNAWPYRDWAIRAFNDDKPFSRMIVEQLAGDAIAPGDPEVEAATGFLVAGPHDTVKIQNIEGEAQKRANHLDDMIAATASAFLGLTVNCARCHDHKFDPIPTRDYYRLQAVFSGVWHDERVWAKPDEIAAYEAAAQPEREAIREAERALKALREGAAGRVAERREEVLAAYRPSVEPSGTEERFEPVEARFVRLTVEGSTAPGRNFVELDEFEVWSAGEGARNVALGGLATARSTRVDAAAPDTYSAALLTDGKHDRRWLSAGGYPEWVTVELPRTATIARVAWSTDRQMAFGGRFGRATPELYRIEVSLDGERWRTVANSEGRLPYAEQARELLLLFAVFDEREQREWEAAEARKAEAEKRLKALDPPRRAFLGRFEQPETASRVMQRGDPMALGDEVAPGSLSALDGLLAGFELAPGAPEAERRLALARWIASDDNALTARVIVNRVWMHHFGRPLVRSPSDFGVNAGEPANTELLDWLAHRLVGEHGWRLKPLHRDMVLSAAYRQSSAHRADAARVDGDAQYLWRYPPRRLDAEQTRDAILAVTGQLDRTAGGPGFRLYRYTVDNVATYYPLEEFGRETYRRAVYHQHARSVRPELLGQLDCPDSALPAAKRESTITAPQALGLMNNAFMLDQARLFAERLRREAGADSGAQVERAWALVFGRPPSDEERADAEAFAAEQGLGLLCRALLNANEFAFVF